MSALMAAPTAIGGTIGAIKDYKNSEKGHNTAKGIGVGLGARCSTWWQTR